MGISSEQVEAHLVLVYLVKLLTLCMLSIRPEFSSLGEEGWGQSKCPVLINNESLGPVKSQVSVSLPPTNTSPGSNFPSNATKQGCYLGTRPGGTLSSEGVSEHRITFTPLRLSLRIPVCDNEHVSIVTTVRRLEWKSQTL